MKKIITRLALVLSVLIPLSFAVPVLADTLNINFEPSAYTVADINGQNGWVKTGAYDAAVVATGGTPATFGTQSLRISDAVTSGSFGDQTFSPSLSDEAGETDALNNGYSGGTRQNHFDAQFDLASVLPNTQQPGMHVSVSPDRGDGARMSYLRFEDNASGIEVFFDDVQGVVATGVDGCAETPQCANFVETKIATLDRSVPHTIKFSIDFLDGPSNDVVKIYIDGNLVHTGTSWEDYYRFDPESNPGLAQDNSRTVDSLLFRESGDATPTDSGKGFLIDNLSLLSGATPQESAGSCSTINLISGSGTRTAGYTETTQTGFPTSLLEDQYSNQVYFSATPTQTVIPPWINPATDSNFAGSGAVWVSSDASWPGGAGNTEGNPNNDQWRLFEDGFNLPVGAVVTSANLYFTADNAGEVYFNGNSTPIVTTNDVYGAVPSSLPFNFSNVYSTTFTPTTGFNHLNFVVRNWGGNFNPNPTGLLYRAVVHYCMPTPPPTSVSVHIYKYIDGVQATVVNANNANFPMLTTFNSTTYGSAVDAAFTLGPAGWGSDPAYQASFPNANVGADYATHEVTGGQVVGDSCHTGQPFSLIGYSVGNTLAEAEAGLASPTLNIPSFTNLQGDKYVIVNNHACPPPTFLKVHILKYLNGVEANSTSAAGYQFPMTATWQTANLNGGVSTSGNYVLGNFHGGAPDQYQADTASMQAPANYTTSEITDNTSQVMPASSACIAGKYRLDGYKTSSVSFADAALQTMTTTAPVFTGLTADQYVIVLNEFCAYPTRSQGFWATHTAYTSSVFNLGPLFVGVNIPVLSVTTSTHKGTITNTQTVGNSQLFGAFWASIPYQSNGSTKRSATDKARVQLLQQLIAAKLNCAAFTCSAATQALIASSDLAYAGSNTTLMLTDAGLLGTYNSSGESIAVSGTGSATPSTSQSLANLKFWDTP